MRVLVIEDNADDRELLHRQLLKSGIDSQVKFIANGQDALDFLTGSENAEVASKLIAIFLDINLPSLNGLELLRRIRAKEGLRNLPVIVMTSSNAPSDMQECERLHVLNYVSKPVSFPTFSKAVANVFHLPKSDARHAT